MLSRVFYLYIFLTVSLFASAQTADFKSAEKFRSDNLVPKYGDLAVNANWIKGSDIFWYSYKTPLGKNYYYVNAASKSKKLMFESKHMAAELRKLTYHPYNDLDLPMKEIKFRKNSTTEFTFMVDSSRFLFDIKTQTLKFDDRNLKISGKPYWATY